MNTSANHDDCQELNPNLDQTLGGCKRKNKTPPTTSTNQKGLCKGSCSRKHSRWRYRNVPFFKMPLKEGNLEQLYSVGELINPTKDHFVVRIKKDVNFLTLCKTGPYLENDIPWLRARLFHRNADVLSRVQEALPPLREVNHKIILIDEYCKYHYTTCLDALMG